MKKKTVKLTERQASMVLSNWMWCGGFVFLSEILGHGIICHEAYVALTGNRTGDDVAACIQVEP
jgi:hypothetical protein